MIGKVAKSDQTPRFHRRIVVWWFGSLHNDSRSYHLIRRHSISALISGHSQTIISHRRTSNHWTSYSCMQSNRKPGRSSDNRFLSAHRDESVSWWSSEQISSEDSVSSRIRRAWNCRRSLPRTYIECNFLSGLQNLFSLLVSRSNSSQQSRVFLSNQRRCRGRFSIASALRLSCQQKWSAGESYQVCHRCSPTIRCNSFRFPFWAQRPIALSPWIMAA